MLCTFTLSSFLEPVGIYATGWEKYKAIMCHDYLNLLDNMKFIVQCSIRILWITYFCKDIIEQCSTRILCVETRDRPLDEIKKTIALCVMINGGHPTLWWVIDNRGVFMLALVKKCRCRVWRGNRRCTVNIKWKVRGRMQVDLGQGTRRSRAE